MRLHFYGGTKVVSGNSYLLETESKNILVDCGMFQGSRELEEKNYEPFPFNPAKIDYVIITHSHLDHIGRLPILIKGGFKGKIFATPPTIDFTHLLLDDTQKILKEKAKKAGAMPVFNGNEIDRIMNFFEPVKYHEPMELTPDISFELFEAGHILGSAFVKVTLRPAPPAEAGGARSRLRQGYGGQAGDKTQIIVFSGDLGNGPVPILRSLELIDEADYVLIESTYGDRLHEKNEQAKETIEDMIEETIVKKGVLMIPSFAMERAQQLLYHINNLVEQKKIPLVPVFFDSPLAINITKIYEKYIDYFNKDAAGLIKSGDDIFKFSGLKFTSSVKESKEINDIAPPKIIIAGSGMSQGGRIVHHEARYLPDERNSLFIVSYQAQGTLGRKIFEGAKEVEINDQAITVRARVKAIGGYSAHADQKGLLDWLANIRKPVKKVFVVHGEEKPAEALAQIIKDKMGIDAMVPEFGEAVELD